MDVSTLCFRPDINSLILPTRFELGVGYTFGFIGVQRDAILVTVGAVVEEDPTACDTVVGPVVDGAFVVCFVADYVFAVGVIVEGAGWYPGELYCLSAYASCKLRKLTDVSESVPLSPALRVKMVDVVIGNVLGQCLYFVLEALSGKRRCLRVV